MISHRLPLNLPSLFAVLLACRLWQEVVVEALCEQQQQFDGGGQQHLDREALENGIGVAEASGFSSLAEMLQGLIEERYEARDRAGTRSRSLASGRASRRSSSERLPRPRNTSSGASRSSGVPLTLMPRRASSGPSDEPPTPTRRLSTSDVRSIVMK